MPELQSLLTRLSTNDPTLTSLSLFGDKLTFATSVQLANALSTNTNLTKLWLNDNGLNDASLPPLLRALTIGMDGKGHPNLRAVYITKNAISDEGAKLLGEALAGQYEDGMGGIDGKLTLNELWLNSNRIGPKGAHHLAQALPTPNGSKLIDLRLNSNQISDEGAISLAEALDPFISGITPQLKTLHLRSNTIGFAGGMALAKHLRANERIGLVALQGNEDVGEEVMERIGGVCRRNVDKLKGDGDAVVRRTPSSHRVITRKMSSSTTNSSSSSTMASSPHSSMASIPRSRLSASTTSCQSSTSSYAKSFTGGAPQQQERQSVSNRDMSVEETIEFLEQYPNNIGNTNDHAIQEINFFNIPLPLNPTLNRLCHALPHYCFQASTTGTSLRTLWLNNNEIGDAGISSIATAIARCIPSLEKLFLTKNDIGDYGISQLANTIMKPTCHLKELWLSNNNIGDEGAKSIAEALKHNTHLEELRLNQNHIGNTGAGKLGYVLSMGNGSALKVLSLKGNDIGDVGGYSFLASMDVRSSRDLDRGQGSGLKLKVLLEGNKGISKDLMDQMKTLNFGSGNGNGSMR